MTSSVSTEIKLALLWASLMSLYIYNDYFSLYVEGTVERISAGRIGPWEATDPVLVALSLVLALPALMIFLSTALPYRISRWTNVVLGAAYTLIEALTLLGSEPFYQVVVVLEISVTILIVAYALRWPPQVSQGSVG